MSANKAGVSAGLVAATKRGKKYIYKKNTQQNPDKPG
jgi:hypothetical protein